MQSEFKKSAPVAIGTFSQTLVAIAILALLSVFAVGIYEWANAPDATETPAPVTRIEVPASKPITRFPEIKLSLRGIVTDNRDMALISIDDSPEVAYVTGQEITADIMLARIYPDRVVLRYHDLNKTVYLKNNTRTTPPTGEATSTELKNPLADPDALSRETSSGREYILQDVRVVPSQTGGFLVLEVEPGSIYDKMDLRPGDVVYSLDAMRIVKLEEIARQNAVSETEEVTLEVVRNSEPVLLQYRFDPPEK